MGVETSSWRVLVVEDEFDSVQVVSRVLQHHGAEVHVARNGFEALQMLGQVEPTLIMMDLALPEMDGWETLSRIRADPHTAPIPVVAMTAYHSVNVAEDALHAGFDAYLPKPLDTNSLIQKLAAVLKT